jgi:hypothetical protein
VRLVVRLVFRVERIRRNSFVRRILACSIAVDDADVDDASIGCFADQSGDGNDAASSIDDDDGDEEDGEDDCDGATKRYTACGCRQLRKIVSDFELNTRQYQSSNKYKFVKTG